ncbi:YrhK family protein [Rhodococcus sp. BP-332]|uniref:YrhK family protein n=1 Tax=Rhodococcus sp. BP-332 TaxID=2739447 RepID=UPI0027E19A65|nr:YrhK family protein [Rhodococcus sp. BP-332]MBY6678983.1 YrhK family protein [Rhodococcus sp. BP-332]
MGIDTSGKTLTLTIGHDELIVRQRWEVVSIVNDIAIAVWFIAGSVLFFSESTTEIGTVLFLLGSIELLIRPVIRLCRRVHIRRVRGATDGVDSLDF